MPPLSSALTFYDSDVDGVRTSSQSSLKNIYDGDVDTEKTLPSSIAEKQLVTRKTSPMATTFERVAQ